MKSSHRQKQNGLWWASMTDLAHKRPWVRVRHARGLLEWHSNALADRCALTMSLVPSDILADRAALTVCLTEELRSLSEYMIAMLEENWQAAWEKAMAGKFVDLPNLQH